MDWIFILGLISQGVKFFVVRDQAEGSVACQLYIFTEMLRCVMRTCLCYQPFLGSPFAVPFVMSRSIYSVFSSHFPP